MTNQEAIAEIQYDLKEMKRTLKKVKHEPVIEDCKRGIKAWEMAIAALKESEQVKPANIRRSDGGITEGFCACGTRVNNYMKFCDQCGKKLDWSGE